MKPLVFLHGWAQSQQIWFQQQAQFPDAHYLNLPGHGGAADAPAERWLDVLLAQLPDEPCVLAGWSLGGMLAMEIARCFPDRVDSLVLIATTPRFRATDGWGYGCDDATFAAFNVAVSSASPRALNRFFALMLHGDDLPRSHYNELARQAVDRQKQATTAGLQAGLELLATLDLRERLPDMPALLLFGEQDAIVPADAGRWLAAHLPGAVVHELRDCGHAPFLSRPEQCNTILKAWWQQ